MKNYDDYVWRKGKPYGTSENRLLKDSPSPFSSNRTSYKILSDPYYKRISIEKYVDEAFLGIVYDSALFDFRSLHLEHQTAWQKVLIRETADSAICQIRNHDDRLILIEEYAFVKQHCRECRSFYPHGILISIQKIYYQSLGDSFDGTILYDSNSHPVICKTYQIDPLTGEFSQMIEEEWDMTKRPLACNLHTKV